MSRNMLVKLPIPYYAMTRDEQRAAEQQYQAAADKEIAAQARPTQKVTATFLTPATNGKRGELIEVEVPMAPPQFMATMPYYQRSTNLTAAERGKLEKERRELQQALPRLGVDAKAKAESRIAEIERELASEIDAERVARREREQPPLGDPLKGGGLPGSSNTAKVEQFVGKTCIVNGRRYVRSDSGLSYLQVA
jgi:hypothetical protein